MALFLNGSYSPDPMTYALTILCLALLLRGARAFPIAAIASVLCKPAYLLVPLMSPFLRRRRAVVIEISTVIAVLAAAFVGAAQYHPVRRDALADPHQQLSNVLAHPLHVLRLIVVDYVANGTSYLKMFVGHLGWLDVPLPSAIVYLYIAAVLCAAIMTGGIIARRFRIVAFFAVAGTLIGIGLSQYLVWTPVNADYIEGIQGRYFLPIGPLAFLLFATRARLQRWAPLAFVLIASGTNVYALIALVRRYCG